MKVKGIEAIIKNLKKEGDIKLKEEVIKVAKTTYELSQLYCPQDTGELKASGKIIETKKNIRVAYTAEHAALAHELPQSSIKIEKNVTAKSQFLREALIESINKNIGGQ